MAQISTKPQAFAKEINMIREGQKAHLFVIWGPAGCGKSTVGQALARRFQCPFVEGDEYHTKQAIAKMAKGIPLTDADRWNWLSRLREQAAQLIEDGATAVFLACSALKQSYRDVFRGIELAGARSVDVHFIYLRVDPQELMERVETRKNHYMKASMVKSQLDCVEKPQSRECDIQMVQVAGGISNVCLLATEIAEDIMATRK